MGLIDTTESWLMSVAVRKTVVHVINVAVAWLLAHGAVAFLAQFGIPIDPTVLQNALIAMFTAAIKFTRDWVALKTGWHWLS